MFSAHVPTAGPARPRPQRRVAGLVAGLVLVSGSVGLIAAVAFAVLASVGTTYVGLGAHGTYGERPVRHGHRRDGLADAGSRLGGERPSPGRFAGPRADLRRRRPARRDRPPAVRHRLHHVPEHTGRGVARIDDEGSAPAVAPVSRVHWTAHAPGAGTQTVRWKATDGPQAVSAMHPDGSRPVRVRVVSSAVTLGRMPWWAPAGTLILGLVVVPTGVVVLRRAIRVRRSR